MGAQLTREESVLVELCHRRYGEEPTSPVELPDGVPGNELLDLAARHRVYGLTISSLLRHPGTLSPAARAEISGIATGLRRRTAAMELERDRVLAKLEESGVRAVVLKGAALLQTVYRRSFERDLHDIDLLVHEESLATAVRALTESDYDDPAPGSWSLYRRHHFHIALTRASGVRVEVHWALTRRAGWFRLDPEEILRDAVEVKSPDALLVVPIPEHMILHLVSQSINESFGFLGRFVDIDRIVAQVPELSWDRLVRTARAGRMEIPAALSLQLTRRLFDTEIPLEVLDELRPGRIVRFHLEAMDPVAALMSQRLASGPTKYRLLRFWLTSGVWRRIHVLFTTLVPSKYDHFEEFRSGRPGLTDRVARLVKLVVLESSLLAQGTLSKLGLRKKAQTRFWSSHASSSERL